MSTPCQIGAVSYLNTKPLVYGLPLVDSGLKLSFDLPSRLADQLTAGSLDVALVPSIEAIANPEYTIVSDACIGCRGPVWSVKLLSRVPLGEIKTLALDVGSRTSCALARVILDQQHGVRPECVPLGIHQDWRQTETDAVLIIGDRAMKADDPAFSVSVDLGEAWHQWTGRPFVFAVWAARKNAPWDELSSLLSQARDRGIANVNEIANAEANRYGLTVDECHRYLDYYLHFQLGSDEKAGLDLFFQHAAELSIIPEHRQLEFHDCQTA